MIKLAKRSKSQSNLDLNQLSNKQKTEIMKKSVIALFLFGISFVGFKSPAVSQSSCVTCDEENLTLCAEVVHYVWENGVKHQVTTSYYGNKGSCGVE